MKKIGILFALTTLLLCAFAISASADVLDDAANGGLSIGQLVTFGSYSGTSLKWYYMGNGYFIMDKNSFQTINIKKVFNANNDYYNGWASSDLNSWLNDSTSGFVKTAFNNDSRIAYVTIPSLTDYEQLGDVCKGEGNYSNSFSWWLRTPYYSTATVHYIYYGGELGTALATATYLNVRPAFKLKYDYSANGGSSPVFAVVQNQSFAVAMKGEIGTSTGVTVSGVTATSTAGSGYTTISGTLSATGVQKIRINGRDVLFKVIAPPTPSTTATVSFGV